eukprot:SAG31_NODE_7349_length_1712_cov_3.934904_1_plen_49_part_01
MWRTHIVLGLLVSPACVVGGKNTVGMRCAQLRQHLELACLKSANANRWI